MIRLVFCLRRREDLSPQQFRQYWRERHGPLVRHHAAVLGIRRYVQVQRIDGPENDLLRASRASAEPFDGIAELWFDSVASFLEAARSDGGSAAAEELLVDERRFIDLARSNLWLGDEQVLV